MWANYSPFAGKVERVPKTVGIDLSTCRLCSAAAFYLRRAGPEEARKDKNTRKTKEEGTANYKQ